jgi:ribosomal protein L7/L12
LINKAKELVEKAPTIIMKSVKKDKTQEIIKKLQENGGNLKLV